MLSSGEHLAYDAVLLTTGAAPRRLTVPGSDLDGLHTLRTVADSDQLQAAIRGAGRVVVIGGGWIGCEVAASARQLGAEVAVIEAGQLPLERVLGPELGAFYRDVHAEHGVEWHFGSGVEELRGSERVEEVKLADGSIVAGDLFVVGVGVIPRIELAEGAGLTIENGVVTDEYLQTSAPDVFAAGDLADAWHPLFQTRIRLEHWSSALNQGPVAAKNMLGTRVAYERIPYFFSDQYDVGMEYSGYAPTWDQVVYPRGPRDPRVHRLLAEGRPPGRRHEREHLGRERGHRRHRCLAEARRRRPAARSGHRVGAGRAVVACRHRGTGRPVGYGDTPVSTSSISNGEVGGDMTPRIAIIGGGSAHWTPRLLLDFVNTAPLAESEVVLMDTSPDSLPAVQAVADHIASLGAGGLTSRPRPTSTPHSPGPSS